MLRVSYLPSCLFSSWLVMAWVSAAAFLSPARSDSSFAMTCSMSLCFMRFCCLVGGGGFVF